MTAASAHIDSQQFLKYLATPKELKNKIATFSDDDKNLIDAKAKELFGAIRDKYKATNDPNGNVTIPGFKTLPKATYEKLSKPADDFESKSSAIVFGDHADVDKKLSELKEKAIRSIRSYDSNNPKIELYREFLIAFVEAVFELIKFVFDIISQNEHVMSIERAELDKEIAGLKSELDDVRVSVSKIETTVAPLTESLKALEDLKAIKDSLNALKTDLAVVKSSVEGSWLINFAKYGLTTAVATFVLIGSVYAMFIKSEVDKISDIQASLASISSTLSGVAAKSVASDSSIQTISTNVSGLQTSLGHLTGQLEGKGLVTK